MLRHCLVLIAASSLLVSCGRGPSIANRKDAMAAFARDAEPGVARILDGFLFESPMPLKWTKPAMFGMQDSSNPFAKPNQTGERIVREGTLPNGGTFFAEAFYSYKDARIGSVTVVVDFPGTPSPKPIGNVPITKKLLSTFKVSPPLIEELMKGIGKGSMSGSGDLSFEAQTEVSGKRVEASTAINRGGPLLLELSCMYFL